MADNTTTAAAPTVATDDIGGVHYQRVKATFGVDGVATDVSATNPLPVTAEGTEYETVAASQTDQALGATGAAGDLLVGLLVIPADTDPGIVQIQDGAGTAITVFAGGTDSVLTLHPFYIPLGIRSTAGAWSITTGASVSAIAAGNFS